MYMADLTATPAGPATGAPHPHCGSCPPRAAPESGRQSRHLSCHRRRPCKTRQMESLGLSAKVTWRRFATGRRTVGVRAKLAVAPPECCRQKSLSGFQHFDCAFALGRLVHVTRTSPGLPVSLVHDHHRLVHQPLQQVQHFASGHVPVRTDRFGRIQVAALGNRGEATEHRALVVAEQSVAPIQRGTQGLLARSRSTAAAHEELDTVVESRQDLLDSECLRTSRRPARSPKAGRPVGCKCQLWLWGVRGPLDRFRNRTPGRARRRVGRRRSQQFVGPFGCATSACLRTSRASSTPSAGSITSSDWLSSPRVPIRALTGTDGALRPLTSATETEEVPLGVRRRQRGRARVRVRRLSCRPSRRSRSARVAWNG